MIVREKIYLDFGRKTVPVIVYAKQKDNETREIEIVPLYKSQKYVVENSVTPRLHLTKPDGHCVFDDAILENGHIIVKLTEQILAVEGMCVADIGLYKDEQLLSSQLFYIEVDKSALNTEKIESSDEYGALKELMAAVTNLYFDDSDGKISLVDYVKKSRTVAGLSLATDITIDDMRTALGTYPVLFGSALPTPATQKVENRQMVAVKKIGSDNEFDLYICLGALGDVYRWGHLGGGSSSGSEISEADIEAAVNNYFDTHPEVGNGKDGEDGISVTVLSVSESTSDGGSNVVTFSDGKTLTVKNGSKGSKGDKGDDGKTPVVGVDYWTDEDKAEIKADNITYISTELAKRSQLRPEFANSIEECADTAKLYVLPDGLIYAYMTVENVGGTEEVTEQITGDFTEDYRLSTSTGALSKLDGAITSPLIDITQYGTKFTIHLDGTSENAVQWANASQSVTGNSMCLYRDDSWVAGAFTGATPIDGVTYNVKAKNDVDITFDTTSIANAAVGFTHVRFSGVVGKAENVSVSVTYEKETEGATETKWTNTGHAFVPADYEDEIVDIKNDVENLKRTATNTNGVPDYVLEEAQEVADKVVTLRNAHSFVFGAFSDTHTTGEDTSKDSIIHAGMGMDAVNTLTQLDLVLNFGDVMVGYLDDTYKEGFKHVKSAFTSVAKAVPYIQMQGNHDQISSDTTAQAQQKYFAYIGSNNVNTVTDWDNRFRNYGYRDFDDQKLRVIYLNTADVSEAENTKDVWITAQQCSWLINTALDFSDKEKADSWGFIVCSHHPLNWYYLDNLLTVLNAYKGKQSGTVTADDVDVAYNFTDSKAEFIAHFHGHLHNFRAEQLGSNKVTTITIPNACFDRNNEYGYHSDSEVCTLYGDTDDSGIQRKFNKISGTADDTAFNVVVIDRDNRMINCINYGAGIDRVISY